MDPIAVLEQKKMPFAELLGIRILSAAPERLTAEMVVRENLCTLPPVLHGGAVMAFADSLGAYATMLNLPEGASTTTIESKTNFLAPAPAGTTVRGGPSRPPHDGVADADHQRAGEIAGPRNPDSNGARGIHPRLTS